MNCSQPYSIVPAFVRLLFSGVLCASIAITSAAAAETTASQEEAAIRAAADSVAESVVQIRTIGGLDTVGDTLLADGPTTGLIVSSEGYILSSAFNFVQRPSSILVTLPSGKQVPAELVATDHSRMTVLLKTSGVSDLPVPLMAPMGEIKPGQWAIAVGRAFRADRVNVTVGIVSAVNRMFGKAVQTDADVSTASYGGPLVDIRGRVIGLIVPMSPQATSEVAGAEWYDSGIGFAVPLAPIIARIEQMKRGEDLRPGLLGIAMETANAHESPAKLAAVRPDAPAGKAGLKKGDRIVELDGKPIKNQTALRFALGPRYAGEEVRVVATRGDERIERTIELAGELPVFRHAFLGILPIRPVSSEGGEDDDSKANTNENETDSNGDDAKGGDANAETDESDASEVKPNEGVVVRAVYPGSPAETSGVRPGDRVVEIDGAAVKTIDDALGALNNSAPGVEVKLKLMRDAEPVELALKAERMPVNVPTELPSASLDSNDGNSDDAKKEDAKAASAGKTTDLKLPEFANSCKVYVPANIDPQRPLAALLWLHARGLSKADDVIDQWKSICDRDGILLIVPSAADASRWERTELEYLRRLSERVVADYKIDPRRVVIYGQSGGGAMAWLLGLSSRDLFRGVAVSAAALPRGSNVPANEPAERTAIFAGIPVAKDVAAQMADGLKQVSEAGYPITTVVAVETAGALTASQREEFARWIDTLDRF
jgi:serine protease Do